jgi:two-component system nitrate/nitrite sensor histidine kinase NarX
VRELLTHFRARVKHEEDIGVALRQMLTRFGAQSGLTTDFSDTGTGVPLHAENQLQVLHILQEALSNVRKHAGATRVGLAVHRDAIYRFTVSDDGRGFGEAVRSREALSVRIMRERAQRIGDKSNVQGRCRNGGGVTLPAVQSTSHQSVQGHEVHA